jgi:hypothetical protein
MNVSFLCNDFIDVIDSPTPYIIGTSRSIWIRLYKTRHLDCNIYDIDAAKFILLEKTPDFPAIIKRSFFKACEIIKQSSDIKASLHLKLATTNLLYKLLAGVPDCFRKSSSIDKVSAYQLFNFDAFRTQFKGDFIPFMNEFTCTQAFSLLIEKLHDREKANMQWVYNLLCIKDSKIALDKQNQMMLKYLLKMETPLIFSIEEIYFIYEKHMSSSSLNCSNGKNILDHSMIKVLPKINYQKTRKISSVYVFKPYLSKISTSYKLYNSASSQASAVRISKKAIASSNIVDSRNASIVSNKQGFSALCTPPIADEDEIADEFNNKEKAIADSIVHRLICKIRTRPNARVPFITYRLRSLTACCEINTINKDNSRANEVMTKQSTQASKKE